MLRHAMKNIMAVLLVMFMAAGAAYGASLQAKMTKVKGDVQMQKGGAGAWAKVKEGDTCGKGTKIKTGPGAEVFVSWSGDNSVKVKEMSQITIDALMKDGGKSTSKVSLDNGKAFAKAGKMSGGSSFEVKTPTAVAGVRGTGFEFDEDTVSVAEGSVSVTVGGEEIVIDAGSMVDIIDGALGDIMDIPPDMLEDLNSSLGEANDVIEELGDSLDSLEDEAGGEELGEGEDEEGEEGDDTGEEGDISEDDALDAIDTALADDLLSDIIDASEGGFLPGTGGIIGTIEY